MEEPALKTTRTRRLGATLACATLAATPVAWSEPPAARTFEITASRYTFEPAQIEVQEGERVIVKLHSTDTDHGFAIKEFKVTVAIPKGGEVVSAEFVASKAGTFRFACSEYCGAGHSRMKGVLVVKPKGAAR